MSIVLVTFPGVLQPSDEAIQQEAELEALLERRIMGNNTYKFFRHKVSSRNAAYCIHVLCFRSGASSLSSIGPQLIVGWLAGHICDGLSKGIPN